MYYKSISSKLFDVFNILLMLLIAFVCIAPILHMIFASVSEPDKLVLHKGIILRPLGFTLKGYKMVFENADIVRGYINSIIYVVSSTVLGVLLTILGGYVLSRREFLFRNQIMLFIAFTIMFNGGLIPFYMVVKALGLVNTRLAMIIPSCLQAFLIVLMRSSFMQIPESMEEAAKIDGANHLIILFKIYVPLAKATIAVIVFFYAVMQWNSWFNAAIFLRDKSLYPIQLVLRNLITEANALPVLASESGVVGMEQLYKVLIQYCAMTLTTIPVLIIYPFLQRYFEKGVIIGTLR
ncbi:carbohydrate ABC transporter permease [Dictyoglomus thermophilum]|uniref:carbohydrate ABC transporter permease n=1 Tax=Dictyoglomus thermophilum TaxID=14 RepID=UPI0011EB5778|nr:carbohydrate ABC transporter permease [Dictyoglomus thermophilum]TYT24324.1 carbohydrate ABC transporter permease [Dictyoglomus thermophilum]